MYRKGKKDKKIFSFGEKIKMRWLSGIDSDSGKIAVTYSIDERYSGICKDMAMSSVAIYDIRTSAFSKIVVLWSRNSTFYNLIRCSTANI